MFDYLNEFLFWAGRNKKDGTYKKAMALKKRGDAYLFNLLCHEWISRFKWTAPENSSGVPCAIAEQLIEKTILFNGCCAFFIHNEMINDVGFQSWRNCRPSGMDELSFYAQARRVQLFDYSGKFVTNAFPVMDSETSAEIASCALIYDNYTKWTPIRSIIYFCERLSQINASINACIGNILGTSIISCSREQAQDIERQRRAAQIGVPYVVSFDENDPRRSEPKLMTTPGAAEELKVLYEAFDKTHADYLQSIGVRVNNEMNKKSGVTPMEIVENRQNVDINLNAAIMARKKGIEHCEKIGLTGLKFTIDNFVGITADYDKNGKRLEAPAGVNFNLDDSEESEEGRDNVE